MKKLVISICAMALSAAMLGASTFAWFSMNRKISATGMKVKAEASQSLVISDSANVGTKTTIDFTSAASALAPCTWISGDKKLVYYEGANVDASTGAKEGGTAKDATTANYADFTVYIASSGGKIENQTITASLDSTTIASIKGAFGKRDTSSAIKIQFIINDGSEPAGELSFAEQDAGSFTAPSCTIFTGDVPKNGTGDGTGSIKVTMRVYFDGELDAKFVKTADATAQEGKTYYKLENGVFTVETVSTGASVDGLFEAYTSSQHYKYVYTDLVNTSEIEIGVLFEATDSVS